MRSRLWCAVSLGLAVFLAGCGGKGVDKKIATDSEAAYRKTLDEAWVDMSAAQQSAYNWAVSNYSLEGLIEAYPAITPRKVIDTEADLYIKHHTAEIATVTANLSANPVQDVQEFVNRYVAFILMGNTDAHLKNWSLLYGDGVTPALAPLYDPVSVSSFFSEVPGTDYGINRAIDAKLHKLGWNQLDDMLAQAGMMRRSRMLRIAKARVRQAQADWPGLLRNAPPAMRQEISRRLGGGLSLTS